MLLCLTLILLMGLSVCTAAGDCGEELALSAEAGPWDGSVSSIRLQLQEVKRGKASQFFGLMGKRVGGISPVQPVRRTVGYQQGQVIQSLLARRGPCAGELSPDQEEVHGPE